MRFSTSTALVATISTLLVGVAAQDAEKPKSAADYYVRSLPGVPKDGQVIKMHAGHIEVDSEHNGNLFFWHFQNKHIDKRQRTVIWLNGGPGCSSMDGAWMEVGPYRVNKDGETLKHNEGSWNEFANLLFVDQPVGTGFSYVDSNAYLHELDEMAAQFIKFMEKFFELFPEYEKDDIYFAGESYAGQHIPYIADAVLKRNVENAFNGGWNMKGLLIGNGWIDPVPQYLSYLPFAYKNGLVEKDSHIGKDLEKQQSICQKELEAGAKDHVDTRNCEAILQDILRLTKKDGDNADVCVNMYDVRLRDSYPSCGMNWPGDLPNVTKYLRRKDVTEAIHINPAKKTGWSECNGAVSSNFGARNSKPAIHLLPNILETTPVLLFSGDQDLICNHIGTEDSIHGLEWNGGKGFELSPGTWAPRETWDFEGTPAGLYQTARNLTYVLFYNSSHMVPFDEPRRSRDMLDRFMGVDIATIGGSPADSRIAGEKGPLVAVGNHPNSTDAEAAEKQKLQSERWNAYYKSGEIALVLVATAAVIWGVFIYRSRRKARANRMRGYKGVDVDEAGAWDEEEGRLSDLPPARAEERYSLGDDETSESEEDSDEEADVGNAKEKPKDVL